MWYLNEYHLHFIIKFARSKHEIHIISLELNLILTGYVADRYEVLEMPLNPSTRQFHMRSTLTTSKHIFDYWNNKAQL